jgi:hypothetical protein
MRFSEHPTLHKKFQKPNKKRQIQESIYLFFTRRKVAINCLNAFKKLRFYLWITVGENWFTTCRAFSHFLDAKLTKDVAASGENDGSYLGKARAHS